MATLPTIKELLATRSSLLELKMQIVNFQIRSLQKYNPNQPRVPAGNPTGGQWTGDGSSDGAAKIAGRYDPGRLDICEAQLALSMKNCAEWLKRPLLVFVDDEIRGMHEK